MKFISAATLLLSLPAAAAFGTHAATFKLRSPSSALFVSPETFYRAVELAEGRHVATMNELDELATELEEFVGCKFEEDSGKEICDKEIQDRVDVAEILRLKIELQLRMDYLKNGNLFAADVIKEHDAEERRKCKEALKANRDKVDTGAGLGLW
mmetsp:Transcript_8/g.14  ORF Transcript_8/g.14 Transcript_8/m.14 type:complete len:154 (-) Transcript_8:426-887(-)|eukprot:CAMPEP_0119016714 /NCGR_PEP_ID=MMETSP1176-20130426/14236_1 /TAXON_ID=265551 /ORGANISM="Synedropsis recta cf, Strain CCMP1620" /LENGTH=153 /DNA_ID=CAMNT_0006970237 /DNA_START=49 /DNA_END=510 /DNA_ORIENTATION=+